MNCDRRLPRLLIGPPIISFNRAEGLFGVMALRARSWGGLRAVSTSLPKELGSLSREGDRSTIGVQPHCCDGLGAIAQLRIDRSCLSRGHLTMPVLGGVASPRHLHIHHVPDGDHRGQLVLDEPPERLYNRWVKDRIEFYKRLEPTAPLRDVPLKVDPNPVHRFRFSVSNGLGNVSDAIWSVVLANPEKAGLEGIHHLADQHLQG